MPLPETTRFQGLTDVSDCAILSIMEETRVMLTTEEAAKLLAERGVLIKGKGTELHPPSARSVEHWCRTGVLACQHVGTGKRGMWLVSEDALAAFTPPKMGTKKRESGS